MNNGEEKITFHDEEVVEKKGPVSKKALIAIGFTGIYLITCIIDNFIWVSDDITVTNIIGTIAFWASIIMGIVALKEIKKKSLSGKKYAVLGIVGPFLIFVLMIVLGFIIYGDEIKEEAKKMVTCWEEATECVDNGDETSTCLVDGKDYICPNNYLEEEQYKNEEE